MSTDESAWEILVYVPGHGTLSPELPEDKSAKNHSPMLFGRGRVEKADSRIMTQWQATLERLMNMSASIQASASGWTADEIEVGFTLSAKGELLFIAEAGAQASVKVKLKRK